MPDPEPVNISVLAQNIGNTLRNLHKTLYSANYKANAVGPVMKSSLQLLLALREEMRMPHSAETQGIIFNSTKSLEELYGNCQQLTTISDDLDSQPSIKDRGELRLQWMDCRQTLLDKLHPVADSLSMLSEATREAGPPEGSIRIRDGETRGKAVLS